MMIGVVVVLFIGRVIMVAMIMAVGWHVTVMRRVIVVVSRVIVSPVVVIGLAVVSPVVPVRGIGPD
jgi:hypothetical protein